MGEKGFQGGSWFEPSSIRPLFLSRLSPAADLAVAVFLTFAGVISVLGNGIVLLVYCWKRKKLRPPELMTINLALCDLGFSLFGNPFFIISSLCHAWVFGETMCLWYGIQGFVFGIGSLLTTCLISVDRCLKICSLRYGQWVEKQHMFLSIVLLWVYTLFWAFLPAFGFGSYGPEPYGTSCTINWWKMRSSLNDRIYISLILTLCFGFPALIIVSSYVAILLTVRMWSCKTKVYRSNHTLASISSSSVTHRNKDLRLAKMAAVVCATFLLAWMPYATVSLISALVPRNEQESMLQAVVEGSTGVASNSLTAGILDVPSLLNWTECSRQIYRSPDNTRYEMNNSITALRNVISPNLDDGAELTTSSSQSSSPLPPIFTLIPAMFAKCHCMINPLIYQIMNREFRDDVYVMVFGQETAERRRVKGNSSSRQRCISLSSSQSSSRKRNKSVTLSGERKHTTKQKNQRSSSGTDPWDDMSVGADALDFTSVDTAGNVDRHCNTGGWRNLKGSTSGTHSQIDF